MEFSPNKPKVITKMLLIITAILMVGTLALPTKSEAAVVFKPEIDYLDVKSPIVITFDRPIQIDTILNTAPGTFSDSFTGIILLDAANNSVEIRMTENNNELIIEPNPSPTPPVPPATSPIPWERNSNYRLVISDHIVRDTSGNPVFTSTLPITYRIGTEYITFEELMSGTRKINQIIEDYTPRRIIIKSPHRYIEELNVIHQRQQIVQGSTTESVTNLDIKVNDKAIYNTTNGDIKKIEVKAMRNNSPIGAQQTRIIDNLNSVDNRGTRVYDFGFTKLPDTSAFDFEIILYDDDDNPIDKRIVKVPLESNPLTTIRQRDRFRMEGRTFTLYHLLSRPRDLQTLLDENRMNEIRVQVVQKDGIY